ncbi:MAG: hypothetical protein IT551_10450 [Novosphingobium sp.]|nr:hypothetical protein [Novosphingobium sp.]
MAKDVLIAAKQEIKDRGCGVANIKRSIGKILRRNGSALSAIGRKLRPKTLPTGRIYISGTGRAGTTFLVQLLTELGLDTGFDGSEIEGAEATPVYFKSARAGFEWDIFDKNGPQIIKSPYLCDNVDAVVASGISINNIIIPVRDFAAAAKSRAFVQLETTGQSDGDPIAGGLWGVKTASDQEAELRAKLANLVEACVRNDIPMTFLSFPRFAKDPLYLFERLVVLFPTLRSEDYLRCFHAVAKAELIHDFKS